MLTLQFLPYHEMSSLSAASKINKILNLVKENKIVLMEGRLEPLEETDLIQRTMEGISKSFKGIELCTIYPEAKNEKLMKKAIRNMFNKILGNRQGLTVIGPATIIKEIKKDPNKIQLLTNNRAMRKRRRKK